MGQKLSESDFGPSFLETPDPIPDPAIFREALVAAAGRPRQYIAQANNTTAAVS